MKKNFSTKMMVFAAICIAVNIILGTVVGALNIPLLFLDTVGTIFAAVTLGPLYGAAVGGLTNVIQGFISGPKIIPFALVNIVIGLVVGWISMKKKFSISTAVITGLILSVVAPLIGTPIAIFVFDGITGDFNDVFFAAMKNAGSSILSAAFIPRVASNIVDKVISCVLVSIIAAKTRIRFDR